MLRSSSSSVGGTTMLCRFQVFSLSIETMKMFSMLVIIEDFGELVMACFQVLGLISAIGYDSVMSSLLIMQKRSRCSNFWSSISISSSDRLKFDRTRVRAKIISTKMC